MKKEVVAQRIDINGIVQGVGFRPFVYNLGNRYQLKGKVLNNSSGVSIHVEGTPKDIELFSRDLIEKCPPRAVISGISKCAAPLRSLKEFTISKSMKNQTEETFISPDI